MTDPELRDPRAYAEFGGRTYLANSMVDPVSRKMLVTLTCTDACAPEGFEAPAGQTLPTRDVAQSEVERYYRVDITCMYSGGGPFEVDRIDRRPDGDRLRVQYTGSDRDWALAQPGIESDEDRRRNREPDVWGWILLSEAEYVQETEQDLIRPRRRRRKPVA